MAQTERDSDGSVYSTAITVAVDWTERECGSRPAIPELP